MPNFARRLIPHSLTGKIAITVLLAGLLGGIGAGLALAGWGLGGHGSGQQRATASPSATPCLGAGCEGLPVQYATLQEATKNSSFVPIMPTNIPAGFKQKTVVASQRDFSNPYVPQVHNDWITVAYLDREGHQLIVSQGFPAPIRASAATNFATYFPGVQIGNVTVADREAIWAVGMPLMNGTRAIGTALTLYIGMFDSGWGQPGSWFSGSPMTLTLASDSLDLDALIAMAKTLQFPPMLPPLNGATPEPYFNR